MSELHFERLVEDQFTTGECPTWDAGCGELLWTSIDDGDIHAIDPRSGTRKVWHFNSAVASFGLCRSGRLVVALRDQVVLFDRLTGSMESLASLPMPIAEARLNDGKVGADGAFWVGSMDQRGIKQPIGALYRVDVRGDVRQLADGLMVSNGLAWSPDGTTMYHSDSRGPWVDRWDFDPTTGRADNRRRFLDLTDSIGRPDGAAVDIDGCYWSAGPSSGFLNRFDAAGLLLQSFPVPSLRPSMPCFGGSDMRTLFVTSLMGGIDPQVLAQNPLCGTVLAARVSTPGAKVHLFAD